MLPELGFFFYSMFFAPQLIAGIVGFIQKRLFLRDIQRAARWWPAVTFVGLFAGAIGGIGWLFFSASNISGWGVVHSSRMNFVGNFVWLFSSFSAFGIITSLCQAWLLRWQQALWYIFGALISSLTGGLAAVGVGYVLWYQTPFATPEAGALNFIFVEIPMAVIISFFGYGVGTSIVLAIIRKARRSVQTE